MCSSGTATVQGEKKQQSALHHSSCWGPNGGVQILLFWGGGGSDPTSSCTKKTGVKRWGFGGGVKQKKNCFGSKIYKRANEQTSNEQTSNLENLIYPPQSSGGGKSGLEVVSPPPHREVQPPPSLCKTDAHKIPSPPRGGSQGRIIPGLYLTLSHYLGPHCLSLGAGNGFRWGPGCRLRSGTHKA